MEKKINLLDVFVWLGWVLLFGVLFFKGCNPEPQTAEKIKIVTKEVKGSIVTNEKVINIPIVRTVKDTAGTGYYVNQIDKLFDENNKMQLEFLKMDSLQQIEAYNKAIQINAFKQTFDDKYINAQVTGEVAGEVKQMRLDYTIKPQELKVDAPKPKNNLYLGVNVANSLQLNKPLFSAGISLKNKRGNMLNASFDTEKRIGIGYYLKIF
jgi:hypothetical protein